ncbi:hypothetical protein, partial [Pseudomonas aeruginosa]|uniref:hypothetical protein n=1 Tax=Pseudomonas aeruginosa TaxID=287 RepID=UPI002341776E
IPPVLELLYSAYGFTGALPREGMDPGQALAAPQATLMTAIASLPFWRSSRPPSMLPKPRISNDTRMTAMIPIPEIGLLDE